MFSVAPPKRRFCRFLYYPWFLRSTPPPTLERAVRQKRTATQSVVSTYLIKKLNEKRKKTRQNIVLSTWFCQMTARQRYLRTPHAAISYVWFRQFFSPAAFSRLLPSVSVTVRRAKTEKGRALFTLERVICFPRQIIPPTTDDVCVVDWLKRGQKKGNCVLSIWPRLLRSLAQNLMSENIPGIWSLAAQAYRRRRRILSARFHLSLCLSRPAFLGSVRLWSNEVEVRRAEGRKGVSSSRRLAMAVMEMAGNIP